MVDIIPRNFIVQMERLKNEAIEQRNDHPDTCCQTKKPTPPSYREDAQQPLHHKIVSTARKVHVGGTI